MDITTKLLLFFVFLAPTALGLVLYVLDRSPQNEQAA